MKKQIILLSAVFVVVSFLVGFSLGEGQGKKAFQEQLKQTQDNLQKKIDWLESQLEVFYPPLPKEIYNISGNVVEKGDKYLVVETEMRVSQFPLPDGKDTEKKRIKVNVTDDTKIYKIAPIEGPLPESGEPVEEISLTLADINKDDVVSVMSDENIKGKNEITAKEIQVGF